MQSLLFRHAFSFLLDRTRKQPGKAKPSLGQLEPAEGAMPTPGSTQASWPKEIWGFVPKLAMCVLTTSQVHCKFTCTKALKDSRSANLSSSHLVPPYWTWDADSMASQHKPHIHPSAGAFHFLITPFLLCEAQSSSIWPELLCYRKHTYWCLTGAPMYTFSSRGCLDVKCGPWLIEQGTAHP